MVPSSNEFILNYIYKNILKQYENKYEDIELGKLITRINQLPNATRSLCSDICKWMLPQIITILIINLYFLYVNPILGLVSIVMLILFLYMNYYLYSYCIPKSVDRHKLFEKNMGYVQDKISNLQSIYSAGKSKDEVETYRESTKLYISKVKDSMLCSHSINIFYNTFNVIIFVVLNSITVYLYYKQKISFIMVMAVFITIIYYSPCIYSIGGCMLDCIYNMGIINQLENFTKDLYITNLQKPKPPQPIEIREGRITIQNLRYSYRGDIYLFDKFNLEIQPGEKIALLGNSGNGKSTLIKLIMGYYPFEGNIYIDNYDIHTTQLNELRKKISYVNQNNKLFNTTILKNIQYGNELTREDIQKMMYEMEIENIFKNLLKSFPKMSCLLIFIPSLPKPFMKIGMKV
jgi:ABC-type multidrug transport system fused ATPase/permease subunit